MTIKSGYTTCSTCNKFAYITSAAMLSQLPDGYSGELCQQCNMWGCALDKLEPKPTKAELYKDFHIPLSELRKEWKRARFCKSNCSDEIAPRDAIRVLVLEQRVKFLEKRFRVNA